jgi:streptogramin lyase
MPEIVNGRPSSENSTLTALTVSNCAVLGENSAVFQPGTNSTTFLQVLDAAGANVVNVNTTSKLVTFGGAITSANYTAANLLTACATNAGALDFSAASKTLTVEDNAVVNQDYSSDASPSFANCSLGTGELTAGSINRASGILALEVGGNQLLEVSSAGIGVGLGGGSPADLCHMKSASPVLILHSVTETDAANGRPSVFGARGYTAGSVEHVVGYLRFSHSGAGADQRGMFGIYLNSGSGGLNAVERMRVDYDGKIYAGAGAAEISDVSGNLTSANGASFGPALPTSITVLNGIVTAASTGGVLEDLDTLGAAAADGEFIVATGAGTLAWESGTTLRTSIGVGTGDSPQFTAVELGNASDTTLTRVSAGVVAIEGNNIYMVGGADVAIADGGTGESTAQAAIDALTSVSGATNEHVLTKDTGTGNAIFKAVVASDELVKIDAGAAAGYIGAANNDGVLRTGTSISYTDGGDFVTINTIQNLRTTDAPTFAGATFKGDDVTIQGNSIIHTPLHTGRRQLFAGNTGLGQSFPAKTKHAMSAVIPGTRTSAVLFTRTAGTWAVDALIGQWAYFYDVTDYDGGTWLPIVDNAAGTITITGSIPAAADTVQTCVWRPIQDEYAHGKGAAAFYGGVYDGESLWLVPFESNDLVKVNPATGEMTSYVHGQGAYAFLGGCYDGNSIWLAPYNSSNIVKVDPSDGSMTTFAHGKGASAFAGAVFDGANVWLVPWDSDDIVKLNPSDGTLTSYAHSKGNNAFAGGVFDGSSIWLVPNVSSDLVKVNISTGGLTDYAHGKGSTAFYGGIWDGSSIWLVPQSSSDIVQVDPSDGSMTSYAHGKGSSAFTGGCFDGENVWFITGNSDDIIQLDPSDGSMNPYPLGKGDGAFAGAVFDGEGVWLIPQSSANLVRFIPPRFGEPSLHTSGPMGCSSLKVGDATDYVEITTTGISLNGAAKPTKIIPLPIQTGGGTVTVSAITGTPSIDFNADGEIVYATFQVPKDWDAVSDMILKAMVQNEIAETDGDDVSITWTVHGVVDGETNADLGQSCAMTLDLTGGDEAINKVNKCSATIVYNDGTYPIAAGDSVVLKGVVNLGGGGECTGPLHIIDYWIEYTANE